MAWLLCLMLLAFLACSISLARAEPDTTWSGNEGSRLDEHDDSDDGDETHETDEDALDAVGNRADENEASTDAGDTVDGVRASADNGLADGIDIDGVATDGLDDAQVDAPAPASVEANAGAPTWAHGVDAREAALRRHTPWFGRVDVSLTWRRALNESTAVQRDEVWLVGTWRL